MFERHFIEDLELCPFGLAAWTFVFFALGGGDRQALYELGDGVDAPFYGVDGGAVVDEVVGAVYGALLAFFGFGAGVSVNRLVEIKVRPRSNIHCEVAILS